MSQCLQYQIISQPISSTPSCIPFCPHFTLSGIKEKNACCFPIYALCLHLTEWQQHNTNFALHPSTADPGCPEVCSQWPLVDLTTYQLWLLHTWSTSASSGNCTGHTASNRSHHFYYTPTKALNSAASENRQSILVQHTILTPRHNLTITAYPNVGVPQN